jgi:cyclic pyranopterin phosphate synthase
VEPKIKKNITDALGRPLRDLRISVIDQCNFRCPYCMPAEVFGPKYAFLKRTELLSFDEIARLARIFTALGIHKIRLTGGEPLLRRDLSSLVATLHGIPGIDDIALTTNGVLLDQFSQSLHDAGLHRVTVSLDAIDDAVFMKMNGRWIPIEKVLSGIDAAAAAGLPVKVNMVVQKGVNEHQILPMARFIKERGHTLRFIEFMDVGNHNHWKMEEVYPAAQIVDDIAGEFDIEPLDPNYPGEVARRYRYVGTDIEIGIIGSVTRPFCANCTRARLSADGKLYTCLFAHEGWDLREILRNGDSDDQILATLSDIWSDRADRYSEQRTEFLRKHRHPHKVEMSYIGG